MKLTPKQRRFAELYIELGNASEAYRQAYDVSEDAGDSVKVNASKLLKNDNVAITISNLQKELAIKNEVTRELLVEECLDVIKTHKDLRKYFDGNKIKKDDIQKIYTLSNSGFIKGADVMNAINTVARLMGFDKPTPIQNNIQINFNTKWSDGENDNSL